MNRSKILSILLDYFLISIGTLIFCLAWTSFIQPNGLTSGGVTGLCTIIEYGTEGLIPTSMTYPLINGILLILGFMRVNPLKFAFTMTLGKFVRYLIVVLSYTGAVELLFK